METQKSILHETFFSCKCFELKKNLLGNPMFDGLQNKQTKKTKPLNKGTDINNINNINKALVT